MQRIQPWCCNKSDSNASICHAVHVSEIGSDTNLAEVRIPPFSLFLGLPPWSGCFSAVWNQIQGSKPYSSSGETAHRNGWCCHFGGWSWQLCNWQCLLGLRLNVSSWGYPSSMDEGYPVRPGKVGLCVLPLKVLWNFAWIENWWWQCRTGDDVTY